ncbi:MAG: cation:proton antiporter [Candidatus Dojkabacteria bacterium]
MENFFLELTIILIIASVISIFFRFFKQPPIMAYILTGIIVAQLAFFNDQSRGSLDILSKVGSTLLLFVIGLEFKISELRSVGKAALITGFGQILITTGLGLFICSLLGFGIRESLIFSFAITFSSTIVIVKLFGDKKDLSSLHGKITVGFLLVQDFCAIMSLIFLAGFNNGQSPTLDVLMISIIKALFLLTLAIVFSQYVFPRLIHSLARSSEILFISSLAWAFGLASLVSSPVIGFSIEIGGFLAGLALANSYESSQIISKVKSLRDFFIVLFFVALGTQLNFSNLGSVIFPAVLISIFIIIVKPLVVMSIMGILGYKSRTSFLSALAGAQISEFSLILLILAKKLELVSDDLIGIITLIAIITFTFSSYLILNGDFIYDKLAPLLSIFEKKGKKLEIYTATKNLNNHIVLLGADRMGRSMLNTLKDIKEDVLVMDFNPDITLEMSEKGYNVIFGDIADEEILGKAKVADARVIVSTIPDYEDNIILLTFLRNELKGREKRPLVILTAHSNADRNELKEAGADYVIMPYKAAGKFLGKLIRSGELGEIS